MDNHRSLYKRKITSKYTAPQGRGIKETVSIQLACAPPEGRATQSGVEYKKSDFILN
jgi:hypothetical protein